jgi:3-methyladenine DNA glycosylase/8-oxoguanine DNA glycosylase
MQILQNLKPLKWNHSADKLLMLRFAKISAREPVLRQEILYQRFVNLVESIIAKQQLVNLKKANANKEHVRQALGQVPTHIVEAVAHVVHHHNRLVAHALRKKIA